MKTNTSLLALGLFTIASVVSVSCGGSSDSDDNNGAAGGSSKAGSSAAAGTSATAGTSNSSAGSSSSAGTTNNRGGTGNTAGTANNNGGIPNFPGAGGAGVTVPSCPAGTMNGVACTAMQGQNACQLNETTYCGCQGQNDPTWTCIDTNDLQGAGGAGITIPEATCPAGAMNGDDCSNGPGLCPGQQCFCGQDNKVMCL